MSLLLSSSLWTTYYLSTTSVQLTLSRYVGYKVEVPHSCHVSKYLTQTRIKRVDIFIFYLRIKLQGLCFNGSFVNVNKPKLTENFGTTLMLLFYILKNVNLTNDAYFSKAYCRTLLLGLERKWPWSRSFAIRDFITNASKQNVGVGVLFNGAMFRPVFGQIRPSPRWFNSWNGRYTSTQRALWLQEATFSPFWNEHKPKRNSVMECWI
jgi:hypothetical protein